MTSDCAGRIQSCSAWPGPEEELLHACLVEASEGAERLPGRRPREERNVAESQVPANALHQLDVLGQPALRDPPPRKSPPSLLHPTTMSADQSTSSQPAGAQTTSTQLAWTDTFRGGRPEVEEPSIEVTNVVNIFNFCCAERVFDDRTEGTA